MSSTKIIDDGCEKNLKVFVGRCIGCLCRFEIERRHLLKVTIEYVPMSHTFERGIARCPQCAKKTEMFVKWVEKKQEKKTFLSRLFKSIFWFKGEQRTPTT